MSTNSREKELEQEEALLENPERGQASLANANVIVNPLESNIDSTTDHANNANRSGQSLLLIKSINLPSDGRICFECQVISALCLVCTVYLITQS